MPRYVAKEDVEKGLVDPTRPLEEQPEYKQKIEKQIQEKEKQHEQKNVQQRPKKQRPPRNKRLEFNWNRNEITLETEVPEKPKKLIEKPNVEKHNEGLDKLKAERELLKKQKQALYDQQRNVIRDLTQSRKNGREAISQYSGAMKDKFNLQNQLRKEIRILDDQKKKINSEMQNLTSLLNEYRKPSSLENFSIQYLKNAIDSKEHQLTTAQISKREEAKLNNEINELKRALVKARPYIQIDAEGRKLEDKISLLYKQLKPIKHELHVKITEANGIRSELDALKEQRKTTQGQTKVQRTPEEIKSQYDAKFKALEARREKVEEKIDDYIDKFVRERDDYDDQQDLLKYIKWVEDQIAYLKKRKQQEELKKKEKQQRQKRRQKEKEEYQKRQEERKKQEQERKARDEARKKKLEEERERYINRNPHHQFIDRCQGLIDYCQTLRPNQFQKFEDARNKQAGDLNFGKEWQKEIKGGAQVLQSKKSKADEQAPKKQLKQKKKQQKPQDQDFTHGIEIVNQFQSIKLLPPNNSTEIDSAIKLIKDKIAFYSNPTQEQKVAFRQKAAKQFDERHAPRDRRQGKQFKQKQEQQEQQPKQKKVHHQKKEKKQLNAGDFPVIA